MKLATVFLFFTSLLSATANAIENGTYNCKNSNHKNLEIKLSEQSLFIKEYSEAWDLYLTWHPNDLNLWVLKPGPLEIHSWLKIERSKNILKIDYLLNANDGEKTLGEYTFTLSKISKNNETIKMFIESALYSDEDKLDTTRLSFTCSKK